VCGLQSHLNELLSNALIPRFSINITGTSVGQDPLAENLKSVKLFPLNLAKRHTQSFENIHCLHSEWCLAADEESDSSASAGKMNLELKKGIMKCLVWNVALCCSRDMDVDSDRRKIDSFRMWIWRRMEKLRWLN